VTSELIFSAPPAEKKVMRPKAGPKGLEVSK
jgi:hypothetical protein